MQLSLHQWLSRDLTDSFEPILICPRRRTSFAHFFHFPDFDLCISRLLHNLLLQLTKWLLGLIENTRDPNVWKWTWTLWKFICELFVVWSNRLKSVQMQSDFNLTNHPSSSPKNQCHEPLKTLTSCAQSLISIIHTTDLPLWNLCNFFLFLTVYSSRNDFCQFCCLKKLKSPSTTIQFPVWTPTDGKRCSCPIRHITA